MSLRNGSMLKMATRREIQPARKHDRDRGDASDNNGYIRALVSPLEYGTYSPYLNWLGVKGFKPSPTEVGLMCAGIVMVASLLIYLVDFPWLLQRLLGVAIPSFSILCAFYWLALFLRKSWSSSSVYILFLSCHIGEIFAQIVLGGDIFRPLQATTVLAVISVCSLFSSLQTTHSAIVIIFISIIRFISGCTLVDLPAVLRPYLAYSCGILGCILAKSVESAFRQTFTTQFGNDGKIPVIRRRRTSSSSSTTSHNHKARRTSLPALIQKQSVNSIDMAAMQEAHGVITDMLVDQTLPHNVVSGLKAISNLISPPSNYNTFQRPKISPLVALSESSYGSDVEDSPFIGERPSALPKRLRRSLPPNLLRRMSSTWTTTTSATVKLDRMLENVPSPSSEPLKFDTPRRVNDQCMPTLEPEPVRTRSSSFRHSRESTPNASPSNSRSVSPLPATPPGQFSTTRSNTIGPTSGLHPRSKSRTLDSMQRSDSLGSRPTPTLSPLSNESPLDFLIDQQRTSSVEEIEQSPTESMVDPQEIQIGVPKIVESVISQDSKEEKECTVEDSVDTQKTECKTTKGVLRKISAISKSEDDEEADQILKGMEEDTDTKDEQSTALAKKEVQFDPVIIESNEMLNHLDDWDFPIFELSEKVGPRILSQIGYRIFTDAGLFETFRIPTKEFMNYFQKLEDGYREKPYHNRIHAGDVLHAVYYLSTQPIPGFTQVNPEDTSDSLHKNGSSSDTDSDSGGPSGHTPTVTPRASFTADDSYGILAGNLPALELMALYVAAAMHDYDHPGRTNAFLVATRASQAILYNDRAVLENHHTAAAWSLLLSCPQYNFLSQLDEAEYKRFRFLVIEFILATDLKRHFDFLVEFNAKVNDSDAQGIDWSAEPDRLLVSQMCIKLADISGPTKYKNLHINWTYRISEEFYEQGDEEARLGLPISPYMDRRSPQLAKLQETFINHLVAPLCNAYGQAGLLPGQWVEEDEADQKSDGDISGNESTNEGGTADEDESGNEVAKLPIKKSRKMVSKLTQHIKDNHEWWLKVLEEEAKEKAEKEKKERDEKKKIDDTEMETIEEEEKEIEEKIELKNVKPKEKKKVRLGPVSTMVESDQLDDSSQNSCQDDDK